MGGDQAADGVRGLRDDDEQAALALLGEVEGRLEEDAGERGVAHRAFPQGELRFGVEHAPAAVGEDEGLDAAGEDLDLLVRAEHQADVAASACRHRVEREGACTGDRRAGSEKALEVGRRRFLRCECLAQAPPPDVDEVGELALLVDEEEGPPAVAEPVQALEAGELDAEVEGLEGCGTAGAGRFGGEARSGTEDQGSGTHPTVLVGREGQGPQGEDDLGDPAGRGGGGRVGRGVDAGGDVMVLGHAPAELEERDPGPAEEDLVVQFHDPADRADQVPVARAQAQAAGHGHAIPGAEE